MTPDRLAECLRLVRWQKDTLAEAIDVPSEAVTAWMAGTEDVPRKVAAWIEALCFVHEAAEESKPSTAGEGFGTGPNREFIPVYSYNLLRSLNAARPPAPQAFQSSMQQAAPALPLSPAR